MKIEDPTRMGGSPGSLNGRHNLQLFRDFGEIGRVDRTLGKKSTCGFYLMILDHHPRMPSGK
jgi:hypothetical protein